MGMTCRLVLPEEKKVLIKSLVENSAEFTDIISGKGGGCIFLLHGSPGVGKVRNRGLNSLCGHQLLTVFERSDVDG
jgi:hypothetical protein